MNSAVAEVTESTLSTTPRTSPSKKGSGSKFRQQDKFRQRKNADFASILHATLMKRLHVTDPTTISEIKLQSAIVPARIPVNFQGMPTLLDELWKRMLSIGTRPFAIIAQDPNNRAIFVKVCLLILEAKVCYAQRKTPLRPPFDLPTQFVFSEITLRKIQSIASKLPFPFAIATEAVGNFIIDNQSVVPMFMKTTPAKASGAVNFSRTGLKVLVTALAAPLVPDNIIVVLAQSLQTLPNIEWVNNADGTVNLTQASVQFWGNDDFLPPNEREVFLKIIASMESKKGFLLLTDITTGEGSAAQAVRFPDTYDHSEGETLYYMNSAVSTFEEQLAPALMLGQEYHGDRFSRFCGNYTECLKHGSSCQDEARHALIWADKSA